MRSLNEIPEQEEFPDRLGDDYVTTGYGRGGVIVDPEGPECLAREVSNPQTNYRRFFLRTATRGSRRGQLVNPNEGGWEGDFRPASQTRFELYKSFLATGNEARLRQAEREV